MVLQLCDPRLQKPFDNPPGCAGSVGWSGATQDPELSEGIFLHIMNRGCI